MTSDADREPLLAPPDSVAGTLFILGHVFAGVGGVLLLVTFLSSLPAAFSRSSSPPIERCADARDRTLPNNDRDIRIELRQDCWSGWLTPPYGGAWRCDPLGQSAVNYQLTDGRVFYEGPGNYNAAGFPANPVFRVRGAGALVCWTGIGNHASTPDPAPQQSETLTAHAPFPGTWIGTGTKEGEPPYPVTLTFTGGTGTTDYATAGCGGTLELKEERPDFVFYRETISYGRDRCSEGVIRIKRTDDQRIDLTWYDAEGRTTGDHALLRQAPEKK